MIRLIHISDTHLGFRLRTNFRKTWFEFGKTRWYENDFYIRWKEIIDFCIRNKDNIDFIIHSGDLFHNPFKNNPYPPPEAAREKVVTSLKELFERTNGEIPFLLIDGNHGVYQGIRSSLMDSITPNFPDLLYYYSVWDLRQAISDSTPLKQEFPDKNISFFFFPYFSFTETQEIKIAYNNWIEYQRPQNDMINVAVVHGSTIDNTLHHKLSTFNYDYIALGHEHNQRRISQNIQYSGSFHPLDFGEVETTHGFLEVDLDDSSRPTVKSHKFEPTRDFKLIEIIVEPTTTSREIIQKLSGEIQPYKVDKWDGISAARLKIRFQGNIPLTVFWGLLSDLEYFKSKTLNEGKFNILQLTFDWKLLSKELEEALPPKIIEEYILENPKQEFLEYLKYKVKSSDNFNIDLLAEIAVKTLEVSLKKIGEDDT